VLHSTRPSRLAHKQGVYAALPGTEYGVNGGALQLAARDANRTRFLDTLFSTGAALTRAVGFKAFPQQMRHGEFVGFAASSLFKKVVLRRENLLDVYVSELKARAVGTWRQADTSKVKVHVFLTDFRTFTRHVEREYRCVDAARAQSETSGHAADWLSISYEDLASSPSRREQTMQRLFAHLGVPPLPSLNYSASLFKQDLSRHSDSVDNYEQLTRVFKGTRFESMLRGPLHRG